MFKLFSRKSSILEVKAPFDGKVIPIEEVKDDVFAQLMMGDGLAIIPEDGNVYSPLDGVISAVATTNHALGITSDDGIELIVHYGIDTVKYKGEGFRMLVKQDQKVKAGDLLLEVDMDYFTSKGVDLTSPVLVTNKDEFEIVEKTALNSSVRHGDLLYTVRKK